MEAQAKPVDVIARRIYVASPVEANEQTAYAIIGALEQHGWVLVRKRHYNDKAT